MGRSISIAMIVKDEADQLAECLASVAGLADELCIVDTGSRDNTVQIARQYEAKITFFIWCDDFAAARNESLHSCTGDWILVIDADERIAQEDIAKIRTLVQGPPDCCYRFETRNYTNTASVSDFHPCSPGDPLARGFAGWYPSVKIRLFPNHEGARFEGQVHETVLRSIEQRGLRIEMCEVPIHHYPFTKNPDRIVAKQELYLQLGKDKVGAQPDDPQAYAELGNQLVEMQQYAQAAAAYREALRRDAANPGVLKDLGAVLHILKRDDEAKHALRLAIHLDPNLAEAWRNIGVIFSEEKEWPLAVECFEQALALSPGWADGHRYLGLALEGAGKLDAAATSARQALEANPESTEALGLYIHLILRLERRQEARDLILGLIEGGAQSPALENALGELYYYDAMNEEAKRHFAAAGSGGIASAYNNLGVVLYKEGEFEEARQAFEQCLAADPGHRGARANLGKVMTHLA